MYKIYDYTYRRMSQPRFEFYEYDIEGYGYESSSFFTNFRKRKDENLPTKRIKVNEERSKKEDTVYKHLESSIDPIVSMNTEEGVRNIEENASKQKLNLSQYLKAYRNWATRVPLTSINESFYSIPRKILMKNSILNAIEKKNIQYLLDNFYKGMNYEQFMHINPDFLNNGGFIFKINVPENEKIISFGDFHGSFHTFLRNIFRLHCLGILDLSNGQYKINDGYRLLFLGDIVDRGNYALDIVYILSQFINNNDIHKIMIIRGNHEEENLYSRNGFLKEFEKKLKIQSYRNLFKYFFSTLPTAIILQHGQTRYWVSHGGIPYQQRNIINFDNLFENDNIIFFGGEYTYIANQIRWNDFSNKSNTIISNRGGELFIIGTDYLKQFLKENNINMILRGHNDRYFNSFIFCKYPRKTSLQSHNLNNTDFLEMTSSIYPLSKVPIESSSIVTPNLEYIVERNPKINQFFHKTPKKSFQDFNLSNGPVAILDIQQFYEKRRILGNKFNKNIEGFTFFPVVTISTNTDNGRPLTRDSFMVIQNVSQPNNPGLFTYQYMSHLVLNNPNNILSKIIPKNENQTRDVVITPPPSDNQGQKTISCRRLTNDSLTQFAGKENHKEKCAIHFYLKKGICTGITVGSRKIQKTNKFVKFYQTSSESTTMTLDDFVLLYESTPFISFTILSKIINENIHQNCSDITSPDMLFLCKKINLFNLLIDNIPNISAYYKIRHPITLLVNKLKSVFVNNFSVDLIRKLKAKSISFNKREIFINEMLNNMNVLFSFFNFICYKLYHDESPSFMREIQFLPDIQPSVVDLYMNHLPHFYEQREQIINSLLGIDNQYIQKSLSVEKIINQRNIVPFRNENIRIATTNSPHQNSAKGSINYQILERFLQRLIKNQQNVQTVIQFMIKDCTDDSIQLSELENTYFKNTNNKSKYNDIQILKQDISEDIVSLITGFENRSGKQIPGILNDFFKNTTNYLTLMPMSHGYYGEVFNMGNQGKIKKKESLFNKNHRTGKKTLFNPIRLIKVLKENLTHFYLYQFSLLQQNTSLQCFPQLFLNSGITIGNSNITSEIQKINGISLYDYLDNILSSSNIKPLFVYNILIQICDILQYYQENYQFVHGDLHLDNILVERDTGKIYLIDFGRSSIKIPILIPPSENQSTIEKKDFYLVEFMNNSNISDFPSFDHDFRFNDINKAKAIDLMLLFFRIIYKSPKKTILHIPYLVNDIKKIIPYIYKYIAAITDRKTDGFSFYSNRLYYIDNLIKDEKIKQEILKECENNLDIFYPENFKRILQECIDQSSP